jgi:diguanylate cyclase (GGDEF)-like protein
MMNKAFQDKDVTLQLKLTQIIVIVSTISLVLAATLFTLFQLREYRVSMVESLASAASITAENAQAAVLFDNQRDANNILAEFSNDPRVVTAAIYTKEKKLFAAYDLTNKDISTLFEFSEQGSSYQFERKILHLYQPITLKGQGQSTLVGYVYLKATLNSLTQQLKQNILVTVLIVLSVLVITILLTSQFQKLISGPILRLLQATSTVKDKKDYSIRVDSTEYLEIHQLCEGFNSMLGEIQNRDKHLQHLALYDELTGIPNRSLFTDRFYIAIAHSKRTNTQLAICFIDLDNFKPINDDFGHEVGDKLLIEVAERITASIRKEDTVSRQGGDEFAVLLGDIQSFEQYEQSIERIYHSVTQPYLIDNYLHKVTVSGGITLYPSDNSDIDTLIRHADQAMYTAKLAGKHCYHLFNPQHNQTIIRKHHQSEEIEQALIKNQLELYYQPKVNMVTGEVFGAEALLRWIHPEKGLVPPLDFLPIIEGSDLEDLIGDWVINQALMQIEEWQSQGINIEVSVNISSHHLQSETFTEKLENALARYPAVEPETLQLEILESSALGDTHSIINIIQACRTIGVNVALDDFGTGYSSLTHIRRLPVDVIKIDQSFVRDILDDPNDYAIVNGVIGLADSFSRSIIAEGVETTEHGLMLLISGCVEAQGYGIARPMPANDIPNWYLNYEPNPSWLNCGNETRTTKENKIKLFKLFSEQWLNRFEKSINNTPDQKANWPIMDGQQCHYYHWMKKVKQEQIFDPTWLENLNNSHGKVIDIANELRHKYQKGDVEIARNSLGSLHIAVNNVNDLLQQIS